MDNTAALLEQVRRLERSASGPVLERAGEEAPSPAFRAAEEPVEERALDRRAEAGETIRAAERKETDRQSVSGAASGGGEREDGAPEPPERVLTPLEEERRPAGSVLLEQLERLERAAVSGLPAVVIQAGPTVGVRRGLEDETDTPPACPGRVQAPFFPA